MNTQLFQQMFEKHSAIMLLIDPTSGQIMESNQAASDFYGYSISQLNSMNLQQEINLLPSAEIIALRQAIMREEKSYFVAPHRLASGEIRTVEIHASPLRWQNGAVLFYIIHDITERKRAEEALRLKEAQHLLDELFKAIPVPVFYKDLSGKYLACNEAFATLSKKTLTEIIGRTAFELRPEVQARKHDSVDLALLARPDRQQIYESSVYDSTSQMKRTFLITKSVIKDVLGQITGIVGVMIDITEQKQIEVALRISEERWQYALEGSGDGVWDWNIQTNQLFLSEQWKKILGYTEHEIGNDFSEWDNRLHPADKTAVYENFTAHFRGESAYQINEQRMLHQDGNYRWILARGKVIVWSSDGQPLRMVGTITDITERKNLEHELHTAHIKMEYLATHDYLTGLHNRVLLRENLAQALSSQCGNNMVALLTIDMDGFKKINDYYGHYEGDRLLIEMASRMKALIRETDMLIRMGGDEFLLIAPGIDSQAQAEALAKRILKSGQRQFQLANVAISLTFSIGIALCPVDGTTPEALMVSSDRALYHAKNIGKNGYVFAHTMSSHVNLTRVQRRLGAI